MRRLLLFAAALGLLGLSTAAAASFSVQSEDIKSFSTPVSISVPTTTTPSSRTYYLGGAETLLPGTLGTTPEPPGGVHSKRITRGSGTVASQTVADRYHSWQTGPVGPAPLMLTNASLLITLTGGGDALAAGLFSCPTVAAPTTGCTQIGADADGVASGNDITVTWASITGPVPVGSHLRVQIMNTENQAFNAQWGYKENRPAQLQVTVVGP